MRDAARQTAGQEPPPQERPDLEAQAARTLEALAALARKAEAAAVMAARSPGGAETAAMLLRLGSEAYMTGLHLEELRGGMAAYTAAYAADGYAREQMYDAGYAAGYAAGLAAREVKAAPGKEAPGPRHARPGLHIVPALVPAAAAAARHAWGAAQHAAVTAATAAASVPVTVPTAALLAGLTLSPSVPGPAAHAASVPAPARASAPAWHDRAVPVPASSRPAPGAAPGVAGAGKAAPSPSSSPVPAAPPVPPPPSAAPPPPLPPVLQVSGTLVGLGTLATGQVTLTAPRGGLTWSAAPSSPLVLLSASGGYLGPGQSVPLVVSVSLAGRVTGGSAFVTLQPGNARVLVTWAGVVTSLLP